MQTVDRDADLEQLKSTIRQNIDTERLKKIEEILQILEKDEPVYNYSVRIENGSVCQQEMKYTTR
ncbi:MAG: hypothetical protein ACOY5B_05480 [Spirochaetota bacterium]